MPTRPRIVLRAYLQDIKPNFDLPHPFAVHFVLCEARRNPLHQKENIPKDCQIALDVHTVEERMALPYALTVINAIRIACECEVSTIGFYTPPKDYMPSREAGEHVWQHLTPDIQEDDINFVESHFQTFEEYSMPETYSRMGNALRLYNASLYGHNADLALIGFVGAIESLFSISPQELSFRLSLILAKFLGDDKKEQREMYEKAKDLYTVRSKLAHGDKIASSEEAAAISIVDTWTPRAGNLARQSIKRIFEKNLTKTFDSRKAHEAFLTDLIFASNLDEILPKP